MRVSYRRLDSTNTNPNIIMFNTTQHEAVTGASTSTLFEQRPFRLCCIFLPMIIILASRELAWVWFGVLVFGRTGALSVCCNHGMIIYRHVVLTCSSERVREGHGTCSLLITQAADHKVSLESSRWWQLACLRTRLCIVAVGLVFRFLCVDRSKVDACMRASISLHCALWLMWLMRVCLSLLVCLCGVLCWNFVR